MKPESSKSGLATKNLTRRAMGGLFWMLSGSGVQAVLRTVVLAILARLLTPADFGLVAAAAVISRLAAFVSEFGMSGVIEQRPQLEERHLRTAFTVYVLVGLLVGGLVFLIAPFIASFFRMDGLVPIVRVFALSLPIQTLSVLPRAMLRRELRFEWIARINVVSYAVGNGVVGITLALLGFGAWALVGASLATGVVGIIILFWVQPYPKRPQLDRLALREIMYFGGGFTLGQFLTYVAETGDNAIVGRWLGDSALGVYGRAYQLLVFPVQLLGSSLHLVLFPSMSRLQEDKERLARVYRRGISLIALVFLPISVAAVVLAPEIVLVLLGAKWLEVVVPFRILAIGMLFRASYTISDSVARATGAVYQRAGRLGFYAVFVVVGALVGQNWGISGVAVGVFIALAVNFILLTQLSLRLLSIPWREFFRAHLSPLLMAAVTLVVTWPVATVLRHWAVPALVMLLVSGAVTGASLIAVICLCPQPVLGQDGMWLFRTLTKYATTKLGQFSWGKRM